MLAVVAYLPVIRGGGFVWDDDDYLTKNPYVFDLKGLGTVWWGLSSTPPYYVLPQYYPMVFTTFWVEYRLWGLNPLGYHLANVILHGTSAVLVWRILRRLRVPGAWAAAAVFAVHPLCVESVAWITERKNVLSTAFALGALSCYLRFADLPEKEGSAEGGSGRRRWGLYGLALLCFVLSLLSKTVTSSLPAVVLVITWWKRGRIRAREVWPLVPMFVLGIALGCLTSWMERHNVGAAGQDFNLTVLQRVLIAGRALWFYAAKLLWPWPVIFIYPKWDVDPRRVWQFAFPLAAVGIATLLWVRRTRLGRGPAAGAMLFAGLLFPALGFVNVYPMRFSYVADHFAYLAAIPFIATVAAGIAILLSRAPRGIGVATLSLVVVVFGSLTWRRCNAYADAPTLWRDTIARNPRAWLAHYSLALELQRQPGNEQAALEGFQRALEIKPDDASLHEDIGLHLQYRINRPADAIPHYLEALRLDAIDEATAKDLSQQPKVRVRVNLAVAYRLTGQDSLAEEQLRSAVKEDPDVQLPDAWVNLAGVLAQKGDLAGAVALLERVTAKHPQDAGAHFDLGYALGSSGRMREAIAQYELGLNAKPDDADAHVEVAQMLARSGDVGGARRHLEAALRVRPDHPAAAAFLSQLPPHK
jgi:tetratricopeptide (TPR) repeat protein